MPSTPSYGLLLVSLLVASGISVPKGNLNLGPGAIMDRKVAGMRFAGVDELGEEPQIESRPTMAAQQPM